MRTSTACPRAPLIRNQFGGNVGGPIKKDKAFFFFEYNGRRDNQGVQVTDYAVPLDSFRNGQISYIKKTDSGGATCGATSRKNTTPDCIGTIDSAQVAALDPLGIGFDPALLDFINNRYPHSNDLSGGDGINTGGFFFNAPVRRTQNDYVARVDYNLNNSMKLWVRGSVLSSRVGDATNHPAPIQFPGDPLTYTINDASYAYVIGHNWTIGANKSNAFYYGVTRSRLNFPTAYNPTGTVQWQAGFGGDGIGNTILTDPYASAINSQVRNYPIPVFRDDFSWVKGKALVPVRRAVQVHQDVREHLPELRQPFDRTGRQHERTERQPAARGYSHRGHHLIARLRQCFRAGPGAVRVDHQHLRLHQRRRACSPGKRIGTAISLLRAGRVLRRYVEGDAGSDALLRPAVLVVLGSLRSERPPVGAEPRLQRLFRQAPAAERGGPVG